MLERIMKDEEIKAIIGHVNDVIIVNNCGGHGFKHVLKVMEYVKTILTGLGANEHTIELGSIAAYLHDVGAIMGKDGHAERSATFCESYLRKIGMYDEDIKIVVDAIRNHSKGSTTLIGASLTLADKIDMCKSRMMRFIEGNYFHDNIKHMIDVELMVNQENIIVNIITDGLFDYNSLKDYQKMITKPIEMAKYLNRNCIFQIDSKEIDLYNMINNCNKHI